jgi:hypothetical protein
MHARERVSTMAWRAPFPQSRLPASVELSIKLVCVGWVAKGLGEGFAGEEEIRGMKTGRREEEGGGR